MTGKLFVYFTEECGWMPGAPGLCMLGEFESRDAACKTLNDTEMSFASECNPNEKLYAGFNTVERRMITVKGEGSRTGAEFFGYGTLVWIEDGGKSFIFDKEAGEEAESTAEDEENWDFDAARDDRFWSETDLTGVPRWTFEPLPLELAFTEDYEAAEAWKYNPIPI